MPALAGGKVLVTEEERVLELLRTDGTGMEFSDDLYLRLASAMREASASDLDLTVLIRQTLRRWSLRDSRPVPVELGESLAKRVRAVARTVGIRERHDGLWFAEDWRPKWLETDGGVPDAAALAGSAAGCRFQSEPLKADPFFERITGFRMYKTPGQRAACRAVMTSPEASTVLAMLPTGSGKTEIALCLANRAKFGVTVIVVPTVALAQDFERRFREHFAMAFARDGRRGDAATLNFAWTASTDDATRERLRQAVVNGQQRILVTSPESMTRALRRTLMDAASTGRLQGFVIDEAHLVTQWGRDFRPEFRVLADLRRDLLQVAGEGGHSRAVTLLLSATLGSAEIEDLTSLMGSPGPCGLIVANALRSEPDIWIANAVDEDERSGWVLDTLAHSPRPAVLYVTRPETARDWKAKLVAAGYSRIALVTGETSPTERAAVLEGIRATSSKERGIDVVVATSAFGLGIDYAHIRTVIHSCLPETVDRWYQELGRGGRDGHASEAFLLTANGDEREARSLGIKVLTPKKAKKRWNNLWRNRKSANDLQFINLESFQGVEPGDYNRRWNAQLIQGLAELEQLQRKQFDVEDLREILEDDAAEASEWTALELLQSGLGEPAFWDERWDVWRKDQSGLSSKALSRIRDLALLKTAACQAIAESYAPNKELRERWGPRLQFMEPIGPCGRCPGCRKSDTPTNYGPAPSPEQVWATEPVHLEELDFFVTACRGRNGMALLTYREGQEDAVAVSEIANRLLAIGVRHLGGVEPRGDFFPGKVVFLDERPLAPIDLTPVSSFSYFSAGVAVSPRWLVRSSRSRHSPNSDLPIFDVLLLPADTMIGNRLVGKDLPAMPLPTAIELLQGT
jgi:ATP-dependent DNA helicase RecQ